VLTHERLTGVNLSPVIWVNVPTSKCCKEQQREHRQNSNFHRVSYLVYPRCTTPNDGSDIPELDG
jgi:hypothetical protein